MKDSINFVDLFDWEKESDVHYLRLMGETEPEERLPAKIVIKIKTKKNANKTNKRALRGTDKKGAQP